jgi:hypothetical protein
MTDTARLAWVLRMTGARVEGRIGVPARLNFGGFVLIAPDDRHSLDSRAAVIDAIDSCINNGLEPR